MTVRAQSFTFDIHTTTAYPATPQVDLGTQVVDVGVVNESPATIVYVSFDGTHDAGRINPAAIRSVIWDQPIQRVWLRVANDPGTPVDVTVMAEG